MKFDDKNKLYLTFDCVDMLPYGRLINLGVFFGLVL